MPDISKLKSNERPESQLTSSCPPLAQKAKELSSNSGIAPLKRVHRRSHSSPHVLLTRKYWTTPGLPVASPDVANQKTHKRMLSPLQLASQNSSSDRSVASSACDDLEDMMDNLQIRRHSLGDDHPKVALSLNNIGNMSFRMGDYAAAAESYADALRCYKLSFGDNHLFVAVTLGNIGTLHWRRGLYDEAAEYLGNSLRIHRVVAGGTDDNAEVANALHSLGIVRFLKKDHDGAMEALSRALQARKNIFGYENVDVSRTVDAMGSVHLARGETNQAMQCYQEALRVKRALLGNTNPSVVATSINVAKVHRMRGELDQAISVYKEALTIQKMGMSDGPMQRDVGVTLHTIGFTFMLKNAFKEAMEAFSEALTIYKATGLNHHDKLVTALNESIYEARKAMEGNRRRVRFQSM